MKKSPLIILLPDAKVKEEFIVNSFKNSMQNVKSKVRYIFVNEK